MDAKLRKRFERLGSPESGIPVTIEITYRDGMVLSAEALPKVHPKVVNRERARPWMNPAAPQLIEHKKAAKLFNIAAAWRDIPIPIERFLDGEPIDLIKSLTDPGLVYEITFHASFWDKSVFGVREDTLCISRRL